MTNQNIASAVGHIPSGLFIICAKSDNELIDGFLASWVQQVSFEPLLVSICIKPGRPAYELIKSGKPFSINTIGEHDKSFMGHFWKGYDPEKNPFKEIPHKITDNGAVILDQAKSTIICKYISGSNPGDHEVVIAEVISSVVNNIDSQPTIHIRKSGMDY